MNGRTSKDRVKEAVGAEEVDRTTGSGPRRLAGMGPTQWSELSSPREPAVLRPRRQLGEKDS